MLYFSLLNKYIEEDDLIKSITSNIWNDNSTEINVANDSRLVEFYRYNKDNTQTV